MLDNKYELKIYNNHDNGTTTMLFQDDNNAMFWINQCRLSSLHFELTKLCKRHATKLKPFHPVYKCCKIILSE